MYATVLQVYCSCGDWTRLQVEHPERIEGRETTRWMELGHGEAARAEKPNWRNDPERGWNCGQADHHEGRIGWVSRDQTQ
jgi:hypothetical protein